MSNPFMDYLMEEVVEGLVADGLLGHRSPTGPVNGARPIKRRRTREEMALLRIALRAIVKVGQPMTCRQVFYRAVSRGLIEKTEGEYQRTVVRLLSEMRKSGDLPYGWIADNTRWQRKPTTYSSMEEAAQATARHYRRALWQEQDVYVEVWLEKDALAGVVYDVTDRYDVPLMVTKGYPSLSFLHGAAEGIKAADKPAVLYYLGDHDPSGVHIPIKVEETLREMAPDAEIEFVRLAVNVEQIESLGLITRPTKRTDTRAASFEGGSVEVDAIEPAHLRRLVRDAIDGHLDRDALAVTLEAEKSERDYLQAWANVIAEGADGQA